MDSTWWVIALAWTLDYMYLVNNGSGMNPRLCVVGEGSGIGPGIYPEDDRSSMGVLNSTCWMMALEQALDSAKWMLSGMEPGLYYY
jgi:hypothetical protein